MSVVLRRRLLEYFENPTSQITRALGEDAEELRRQARTANRQIEKPLKPYDSWFEVDVALQIASRGYRVVPQYPFAGKKIDLVIEGTKSQLAVECDGDYWHGPDQYEKDMERQRMLERCGWRFLRIRESTFIANPVQSLEERCEELRRQGIYPVGQNAVAGEVEHSRKEDLVFENMRHQAKSVSSFTDSPSDSDDLDSANETTATNSMTIQEALHMKPYQLGEAIVEILKNRPNCSCVKDALPGLVLRHLQVITRGKPREAFTRKINQSLKHLQRESRVEIYKSKNVRVRLITQRNLTFDRTKEPLDG